MLLALGMGSGKSPKAPGTFGTLAAIIPVLLTADWHYFAKGAVFIFLFAAGTAAAEYYEKYTGKKDASEVVIDEIAAFYFIYLFFPPSLFGLVVGFILFRIFDITKPYPIKKLESTGGGVGVMIDDMMAAFYSMIGMLVVYTVYYLIISH
jgi:phosphatidylglycerophosphatase A